MKLSNLLCFALVSGLIFLIPSHVPAFQVTESWMNIYSGENDTRNPVGFSHTKIEKEGRFTTAYEQSEISVKAFETENKVSTEAVYRLENGQIISFEYALESHPNNYEIKGISENGKLKVVTRTRSNTKTELFDFDNDFIIPPLLPSWLAEGRLKAGEKYSVLIFDPFFFISGFPREKFIANITVKAKEQLITGGKKYQAYRVNFNFLNTDSEFWIDEEGMVLKEVIPPGFVSLKADKSEVVGRKLKSYDVISNTSIRSPLKIKNPREIKYMKFEISGSDNKALDISDGYSQFVHDGKVEIRIADINSGELEMSGFKGLDNYLSSTTFVHSNNEKIISKQKSITAGSKNRLEGVKKINEWVYENIDKTAAFSVPDSLDILESLEGDCNEHSVLFAALSRSYGVPTKIALGLVYLDGRFFYHAWNEVYLGKWITVDSTFGQLPSDATHIKLIEGGIEKSVEIIKLVGRLNIRILEVY